MKLLLIKKLLQNCFFATSSEIFELQSGKKCDDASLEQQLAWSPLILGRDSYQEVERSFPVTDQTDLKAILNNELSGPWMSSPPLIEGNKTHLKLYLPSKNLSRLIKQHKVLWLPESLLLQLGCEKGFYEFKRFDQALFFLKNGQKNISSLAVGAYKNATYFLLSAGIETSPEFKSVSRSEYLTMLQKGLGELDFRDVYQVAKAQLWVQYAKGLFHWPSLVLGGFLGLFTVTGAYLGVQHIQLEALQESASNQEIRRIVNLEKRVQVKTELLQKLASGKRDDQSSFLMWQLLAAVMENDISVVEFSIQGDQHLFRLQSDSGIDALEFIRGLGYVNNAEFTTSVQKSRGKERYSILLDFKESSSR